LLAILAIESDTPEINPNPNTAATIAIIKNTTAQPNHPDNPFCSFSSPHFNQSIWLIFFMLLVLEKR